MKVFEVNDVVKFTSTVGETIGVVVVPPTTGYAVVKSIRGVHTVHSSLLNFLIKLDALYPLVLNCLTAQIHEGNINAGWWSDPNTGQDLKEGPMAKYVFFTKLALTHSELSEAGEGIRKDLKDDKLPHRDMAEVEFADTLIRLLDLAGAMGYDIGNAVKEKREYNANRADHKIENRNQTGGKSV